MKPVPVGKLRSARKIGIIAIVQLDEDGSVSQPVEYEYLVVVFGSSPMEVFSPALASYQDAVEWIAENGLQLGASPD